MNGNIIDTEDLTFLYAGNDRLSLDGVDIHIRKGVKTAILGANGAGKSTLFYHLNGVFEPSEGKVLFDGEPLSYRKKALRSLRSRVSVVLQNPDDQIFGQTVEDDIAYGPRNMRLPENEVQERVESVIKLLGLESLRKRNTLQLSYGQRKRLALAGALAMRPEVLIMDEPTAGLDPQMALELMELAEQLHHTGTTVIISTHDIDLAYAWADDIHVLRKGKLIYSGDSEGFYFDSATVYLTGIVQPSMFLINKSLCGMRGVEEEPYPRTETQLVSKMVSGEKGRFRIMPVKGVLDKYVADRAIDGLSNDLVMGIFGVETRGLLLNSTLPMDYVFDGFEMCMSDCLMGKDAVLFCDESCIDLVESKIRRLEDFGTVVDWSIVDRDGRD